MSPYHLVFKMGAFVSQLATVAEIWRDDVGSYTRFSQENRSKRYQNFTHSIRM